MCSQARYGQMPILIWINPSVNQAPTGRVAIACDDLWGLGVPKKKNCVSEAGPLRRSFCKCPETCSACSTVFILHFFGYNKTKRGDWTWNKQNIKQNMLLKWISPVSSYLFLTCLLENVKLNVCLHVWFALHYTSVGWYWSGQSPTAKIVDHF